MLGPAAVVLAAAGAARLPPLPVSSLHRPRASERAGAERAGHARGSILKRSHPLVNRKKEEAKNLVALEYQIEVQHLEFLESMAKAYNVGAQVCPHIPHPIRNPSAVHVYSPC